MSRSWGRYFSQCRLFSIPAPLGDVMNGKITCVVVKDLSRFARNYSDAKSLIDNLFVRMGVRFISLVNGVAT